MPIPYTATELYAIKAALEGQHDKWRGLRFNGQLRYTLENLERNGREGLNAFARSLAFVTDPTTLLEIHKIDTATPPPESPPPGPAGDDYQVPDLPACARLTPAQEREAQDAGRWEHDWTAWAGRMANQTPLSFHQASGLTLAGVAIGRRLFVSTHWDEEVFPNMYVMVVAVSTYYHKTTALRLAEKVLRRTMPHMYLPEPGSPENLINQLSGNEKLLENMRPEDIERYRKGVLQYAAQRLIVRDELSGLFRSLGKDYMAGMKERIMQLYDCPTELPVSSNSRGTILIKDAALSIIGTTTPAGLGCSVTDVDWRDGNLARFALITPEASFVDRPAPEEREACNDLEDVIFRLHRALPEPPPLSNEGERPQAERWSLEMRAYKHFMRYSEALRTMTSETAALDDRLRPLYGRHPTKALKIAVILAALDWITEAKQSRPIIEARHWFRGQQIAEEWRASAHRCLKDMTTSAYNAAEIRVRYLLGRFPSGITRSDLLRKSDLQARQLDEVLHALMEGGEIEAIAQTTRGRNAQVYRWVQEVDQLLTPPQGK